MIIDIYSIYSSYLFHSSLFEVAFDPKACYYKLRESYSSSVFRIFTVPICFSRSEQTDEVTVVNENSASIFADQAGFSRSLLPAANTNSKALLGSVRSSQKSKKRIEYKGEAVNRDFFEWEDCEINRGARKKERDFFSKIYF